MHQASRTGLFASILAALVFSAQAIAAPVSYSIKLDHFGYRPAANKVAIFTADPGATVEVRNASDQVVFTIPSQGGSITSKGVDAHSGDTIWWVDFTGFTTAGTYRLYSAALGEQSYDFTIGNGLYAPVVRQALKTFYLQRCNTPKAATHAGDWADAAACHAADATTSVKTGHTDHGAKDLTGGWHDAGDYNKYVWKDTATALYFLLRGYEDNPTAFQDGDLNIPESGNGVPDLLDEVKWELDWMLKMQLPDGSVLSRTHVDNFTFNSPPSADASPRYYYNPTIESAAVLAGSFSFASRVYRAQGMTAYADTLKSAAESAWGWLLTQSETGQTNTVKRVKLWAAAEVFRTNPSLTSARDYVDNFNPNLWASVYSLNHPLSYDTLAAFTYIQAPGATAAVVSQMRAALADGVDTLMYHSRVDHYYNGMQSYFYDWGSNATRAAHGVFLLTAAKLGTMNWWYSAQTLRNRAEEFLHYFHGKNPLSMVYLTNMAALGGEHSTWRLYHGWFGASDKSYSVSNYIGKPLSVVEPHYPYFSGNDNHGINDFKSSLYGPAPGFIPAGPNPNYGALLGGDCGRDSNGTPTTGGTAQPPLNTPHINKYYRDWNDQTVQSACSWRINENSISLQGPYVALGAYFMQ